MSTRIKKSSRRFLPKYLFIHTKCHVKYRKIERDRNDSMCSVQIQIYFTFSYSTWVEKGEIITLPVQKTKTLIWHQRGQLVLYSVWSVECHLVSILNLLVVNGNHENTVNGNPDKDSKREVLAALAIYWPLFALCLLSLFHRTATATSSKCFIYVLWCCEPAETHALDSAVHFDIRHPNVCCSATDAVLNNCLDN